MIKETEEAVNLLYKSSNPPINEIYDNTINLKTIESNGILSIKSILELTNIFNIAKELKEYFSADFINKKDFEQLSGLFDNLYSNNSIIDLFFTKIIFF